MLPKPPPREGNLGFLYIPPYRVQGLSVAGEAMMVVSVDSAVPDPVLAELGASPGVREARVVELPALG